MNNVAPSIAVGSDWRGSGRGKAITLLIRTSPVPMAAINPPFVTKYGHNEGNTSVNFAQT